LKITLVRHLKVDLEYEKSYDSESFTEAMEKYDTSGIIDYPDLKARDFDGPVYVSDLKRTHLTLQKKFNSKDFTVTPLIREVPLKAFRKSGKIMPRRFWQVGGRVSWFLNLHNQGETLRETIKRAEEFLSLIEREHPHEHVLVITHGVFMKVMSFVLKMKGYKGPLILRTPRNGEEFEYSKEIG